MKSILSALYDGKNFPVEQFASRSEEYHKAQQEHNKRYDEFIEILKALEPPLDNQLNEIMDEQLDMFPIELSEVFADGFRLGARIMFEVFQEDLCFNKK